MRGADVPMPWCEPCQSYHHPSAPGCFAREERTRVMMVAVKAFDRGLRWGVVLGFILGAVLAVVVWAKLMGCE